MIQAMYKPFSKQQREGLSGFIGGAIIRLGRGSETEFERLYLKLDNWVLEASSFKETGIFP
jgi:hypothetical protein